MLVPHCQSLTSGPNRIPKSQLIETRMNINRLKAEATFSNDCDCYHVLRKYHKAAGYQIKTSIHYLPHSLVGAQKRDITITKFYININLNIDTHYFLSRNHAVFQVCDEVNARESQRKSIRIVYTVSVKTYVRPTCHINQNDCRVRRAKTE